MQMDSQIAINKEDNIDKQNQSFSYIAIPIDALDLSNQEVQAFLSQNIIVKSLPDNKFCVVETQNAIRPSVIEYSSNSDPTDLLQDTQITLSTSENNNILQQELVQNINPKYVQNKKKKKFQCNICSTKFKNSQYYQNHMQQHHRKKKYKCDHCSASFNVQDNFMIHKAMHTKGEPACPLCDRKFQRLASLKSHLLLHQIEETFTCSDCQLEFENEDEFNDHVASHLSDLISNKTEGTTMKRVCSYCNSNFESYKEYKEHVSYHIKVNRLLHNVKKSKRKTNNKEYQHKCEVCQKSFPKVCLLERHFRIHSGEKPFVCKECNRGFAQKGTLQIHMSKHTGVKPFLCTLCPARFCQKGNLRVHVEKTHTVAQPGENMYKCSLCSCIFKKVASLNGHITRIHSGKKYDDISAVLHQLKELEKQTCGKTNNESKKKDSVVASEPDLNLNSFQTDIERNNSEDKVDFKYVTLTESIGGETVRNYEVKQRKVGDVRWYVCSFCTKEFKKPSDLLRHIRVHTREKPYSCDICKQKFSLKSTLSTHLNTHVKEKLYKCKICDRLLATAKALYVHTRRHERGELSNEKQKEKHVSTCNICKRSGFQNELELKVHIEEHKKDQHNGGGVNDNQNKQPLLLTPEGLLPVDAVKSRNLNLSRNKIKPHICSVCCASFSRKVHLKRHFLTHTGERKFKCEICPKSFYTTYAMNEHLKFHYNIKNHACKICGKRFVTRAILKRHSVTHSTQKPYFCPICSKQFKTISLCRKHMLTHSTERPFACSYCEKTFKTVSMCRDHIKIHKKQNEKDLPDFIRIIPSGDIKGGESHNTKNEIILNAVNSNVHNLNPSSISTTNIGDIINSSGIVTAEVLLDNQKNQEDQIPMLLQIEKVQNSDQIQINNNIPLENNSSIQTIFIDYDDFQMRLLPNYNFLTTDFSQVKGGNDETQNNLEQSNILLSIDPALNQINEGNTDTFLTANVASIAATDLVEIQNSGIEQSEQLQSQNFDKIVVTENVSDLTLSHHNVALFGAEDFTDYGIHVAPSEIITDKITTSALKDLKTQCSPVNTKSTEESSQLNDNDNPSEQNAQENNEAIPEELHTEKDIYYRRNNKKSTIYQCTSCYRTFTKKSTFVKHHDYHRKKQDNVCKFCSKMFKKPSDLVRHLRTHTGERPFQCSQCEKSFSLKSTLDSHYKTHKPGGHKEFNCLVCNSYFSSKSSLKVHMLLHTGAKPYSCPSCPLKFRTTGQRQSHIKKHTKEGNKEDKITNGKSKSSKRKLATLALEAAQLQEITEACPDKESQVLTNEQTGRSVKTISEQQSNKYSNKAIEMDTLFYQLDFEGNSYIHENLGTIPISFIQLDDDNLLRIRLAPTDSQLIGVSDLLLTDTSVEPVSAQQTVNNQTNNVNDFTCSICKKKLKNQKVLKKHMKIHERKKYFCDKCAKMFAFEHELIEHNQIHNGIKRFPCNFCANKFDTDANLKIHMKRMHTLTSEIPLVN